MKKIKVNLNVDPVSRHFLFESDAKDKKENNGTEYFINVLRYWWGKEANEET